MDDESNILESTKKITNILDNQGFAADESVEARIDDIVNNELSAQHHAIIASLATKADEIRVALSELRSNSFDLIAQIAREEVDRDSGLALLEELLEKRLSSISSEINQVTSELNGNS